jgi:hypothetical protein
MTEENMTLIEFKENQKDLGLANNQMAEFLKTSWAFPWPCLYSNP